MIAEGIEERRATRAGKAGLHRSDIEVAADEVYVDLGIRVKPPHLVIGMPNGAVDVREIAFGVGNVLDD